MPPRRKRGGVHLFLVPIAMIGVILSMIRLRRLGWRYSLLCRSALAWRWRGGGRVDGRPLGSGGGGHIAFMPACVILAWRFSWLLFRHCVDVTSHQMGDAASGLYQESTGHSGGFVVVPLCRSLD